MALNYPGPYELRFFITVDGITHVNKLNINLVSPPNLGTPFEDLDIVLNDASSQALDAYVDDWIVLIQPRYADTDVGIDYVELWEYPAESFDASYRSVYSIGLPGTNASPYTPAQYEMYTFRTVEGGIMRVTLMESSITSKVRAPYGSLGAGPAKAIMDFVAGDAGGFIGRDTSAPLAPIAFIGGENEKLFRQRYR